jgi:hypothetical protein
MSCYGFDREMVSLRKNRSRAVRTGRWMARRDDPFAVFVFGMRLNRLRGLPRFAWGQRWWPPFCLVVDWVVAAILVVLIAAGVDFHH